MLRRSAPSVAMTEKTESAEFEPLWKQWERKSQMNGERSTVYNERGERYKGSWKNNKRHGKGIFFYKNGNRYEGEWKDDKRDGLGTLYVLVADEQKLRVRYSGAWVDDKQCGIGVYYNAKGECFNGDWLRGKRHGKGRQTYGGRPVDGYGGDVYQGDWMDDKRCGYGVMTYANGDLFEGEWLDDKKHGKGFYTYRQKQKRYDGIWKEGLPTSGTYTDLSGDASATLPPLEAVST